MIKLKGCVGDTVVKEQVNFTGRSAFGNMDKWVGYQEIEDCLSAGAEGEVVGIRFAKTNGTSNLDIFEVRWPNGLNTPFFREDINWDWKPPEYGDLIKTLTYDEMFEVFRIFDISIPALLKKEKGNSCLEPVIKRLRID